MNIINEGKVRMVLVDCGAPKSVVDKEWIAGYLKDMKVDESKIVKKNFC